MSLETFQKVLDHIPLRNFDSLSFVGIGEPLLNKNLPEFIKMAKRKFPKVNTWVTTNASLLTEEKLQELLESEVDTIDISFNGIVAKDYELIMKGGNFKKTVQNIERSIKIIQEQKSGTRLQINFLDGVPCEKNEVIEFWKNLGIKNFRVGKLGNRSGSIDMNGIEVINNDLKKHKCSIFDLFTFIAWNGKVHLCCNDTFRKNIIGDIRKDNWIDIKKKKKEIIRKKLWPSICKTCSLNKAVWDDREVIKALVSKFTKKIKS